MSFWSFRSNFSMNALSCAAALADSDSHAFAGFMRKHSGRHVARPCVARQFLSSPAALRLDPLKHSDAEPPPPIALPARFQCQAIARQLKWALFQTAIDGTPQITDDAMNDDTAAGIDRVGAE